MKERIYSTITLERYLLGELPDQAMNELREAEASDPALRAQLDALRKSNDDILAAYPPEFMKGRIEAALPKRTKPLRRRLSFALIPAGAAAAAAIALFLFTPTAVRTPDTVVAPPAQNTGLPEQTRFKGDDAKLFVYRKTDGGPEMLASGARAHEGQILQIAYASSKKYGVIFSIDGRGTVTLHFPADESGSTRLGGGTVYLPSSYQLDDAPSFERFFFVASDTPFDAEKVLPRARKAALDRSAVRTASVAPDGFSETSVLVEKEAR